MRGWVDALVQMDVAHAEAFGRIVERHASSLDATYWFEDRLLVTLVTEEDEFWFRMAALDEATVKDIRRVGKRKYSVSMGLETDVRHWIGMGLFEGTAVPGMAAWLELRDRRLLRRISTAMLAERSSLVGGRLEFLIA